jgi:surface carbohydrate biosynthesis protein
MKKKVCYIQYEIENRELRSRLYLGLKLLDINTTVVVFQHSQLPSIALFANPGIILLKSTPIQFDYLYKHMIRRGFTILAWQEEGIHHNDHQLESPVFSKFSSNFISKYFAWHPADAAFAIRQGVNPSSITVTGNIRMELASSISNYKSQQRNPEKIRILVITNFDTSQIQYNYKQDRNISAATAENENKLINRVNLVASKNALLYREMLDHPESANYEFIIRPYIYEKNPLKHVSARIDENNSIFEAFKSTDIVLHYGSTAGIEGIVSGCLSLLLTSEVGAFDERILRSSKLFTNCTSLFSYLTEINENKQLYKEDISHQQSELEKNYNFNFSNSFHSKEILNFISKIPKTNSIFKHRNKFFIVLITFFYGTLKNRIKKFNSKTYYQKSSKLTRSKILKELENLNADSTVQIRISKKGKILILN